jgi:hypothetical protein
MDGVKRRAFNAPLLAADEVNVTINSRVTVKTTLRSSSRHRATMRASYSLTRKGGDAFPMHTHRD